MTDQTVRRLRLVWCTRVQGVCIAMERMAIVLFSYLLFVTGSQARGSPSRNLLQATYGDNTSNSTIAASSSTTSYFAPHWGGSFQAANYPVNQGQWAPASAPANSSAIFYMDTANELKYTVRLQAALQPGDAIQSVLLVGSYSNDTGDRPVLAYLFGPDASLQAPAAAADGSTPWEVADGLLYPEDILDESPYLFVEIPGRLTGSYSGYNVDPLFVVVNTVQVKEAFIAGLKNGLKPLNVAALKFVDQDTSIFQDASANMSSNSGMSASGGNIGSSMDPADTVSTAAPAAAPGAAAGPAGAAAGPASAVVVGYGTSTFHVDLAASPGVATNATGVVYVNINPQENTLHYRIFLKNLTPYALVQNVTWYAADQGAPRLIMTKKYGLRNGPNNPSGGLGVPADGALFALTTGNIPDENLLGGEATEDTEIFRYKQISRALRYNALLVSVNTVVHPEGLLQGTSVIGPASNEWPAPSV
ncbi:hypothetical protein WJX75_004070 [Coccomyxa subellipsoidea]|uniref:CHRD domain-containing protein n=1 Tax=Coccomyxa subellipsoidea TaxID=248742 RepID=A0ABR2Z3D8_9CHLO